MQHYRHDMLRWWTLIVIVACSNASVTTAPQPAGTLQPEPTPTAAPQHQVQQRSQQPTNFDYAATCREIAADIEHLARKYPQLDEYRAIDALKRDCWIDFAWHTHHAAGVGGWTSGVPSPDHDGVWFHIGFWDPASGGSQIDTQPVMPNWWIGDRRVTFLILEGDRSKSVASELFAILTRHGLVTK